MIFLDFQVFLCSNCLFFIHIIYKHYSSTVMDGINLELRKSDKAYMLDFVTEMRRLMDAPSNNKKYLITANPGCFHPNRVLHDSFNYALSAFDHLFVNFDSNECSINQPGKFEPVFHLWYDYTLQDNGPDIYIGLPSSPENTDDSQRYLERNKFQSKLDVSQIRFHSQSQSAVTLREEIFASLT